jgi:hypothetical protein
MLITMSLHKGDRLGTACSNFLAGIDAPKTQFAFVATYNVFSRGSAAKASNVPGQVIEYISSEAHK